MLHESAAFSVVLSHSCPPRRATRSVVLSHKISTPPACWPGKSKFSSGQLSTQSSAKNTVESRNARCWCASCPRGKKEERQGLGPRGIKLPVAYLTPFLIISANATLLQLGEPSLFGSSSAQCGRPHGSKKKRLSRTFVLEFLYKLKFPLHNEIKKRCFLGRVEHGLGDPTIRISIPQADPEQGGEQTREDQGCRSGEVVVYGHKGFTRDYSDELLLMKRSISPLEVADQDARIIAAASGSSSHNFSNRNLVLLAGFSCTEVVYNTLTAMVRWSEEK
ncbi:hypothetical protein G4B88_015039 [Cannabis sativa]|uniref:Uncharacterized protein n=1 Tax=Cannabis sativa TaxID=3483 RepID=A0A7J6E368_CANSA|nr:hypothetical protein G4B88_015039 [Cannabis sativa]